MFLNNDFQTKGISVKTITQTYQTCITSICIMQKIIKDFCPLLIDIFCSAPLKCSASQPFCGFPNYLQNFHRFLLQTFIPKNSYSDHEKSKLYTIWVVVFNWFYNPVQSRVIWRLKQIKPWPRFWVVTSRVLKHCSKDRGYGNIFFKTNFIFSYLIMFTSGELLLGTELLFCVVFCSSTCLKTVLCCFYTCSIFFILHFNVSTDFKRTGLVLTKSRCFLIYFCVRLESSWSPVLRVFCFSILRKSFSP